MNLNDVLALAKAGFSAEQIAAMYAAPATAPAQPAPAESATPAVPVVTAPPAPASAPVVTAPHDADPFAAIMREMASIKSVMQSGAILSTSQPPAESVESILASIINPKEG